VNFGATITGFGVVDENIGSFEVLGAILAFWKDPGVYLEF
jgi:hypothetical protein